MPSTCEESYEFSFTSLDVAIGIKNIQDVKLFGVASKGKHESLKDRIDHLLERGTDYVAEIRKSVFKFF